MESVNEINEIKEALSARSRTATLDELRNEGRKRVRLIRAEHVAQMITEAVHGAIEASGLLDQTAVDKLIASSRKEFKNILGEREKELQHARVTAEQLEAKEHELSEIRARFSELRESMASTRAELELARTEPQPAAQAAPSVSSDMMMSLMNEVATLKASMAQPQPVAPGQPMAPGQEPAPAPAMPDFSAAIEKLAGSLNDRLESIGKKVGISAAVDGDVQVDFGAMFEDDNDTSNLESNMANIKVKQKSGGGIADNLARLKKLKGSG